MRKLALGLLALMVLVASLAAGLLRLSRPAVGPGLAEPMDVGFTFSERQAGYLDVPWQQAFQAAMGLDPNLVRLGAYWDTIEPRPGSYDFTTLDWLLDNTPTHSSVLLTVGMKAPRWPEFYLPKWLRDALDIPNGADVASNATVRQATLRYIAAVVRHERDRPNIKYWQVENEPLDPSGAHHWWIDSGFLSEEIALVRSLDRSRPIVVSLFVDTSPLGLWPAQRDALQDRARRILRAADILGLDVYAVRPVTTRHFQLSFHWPMWLWEPRVLALQRLAYQSGKQIWISEAQAEPWPAARLADTGARPAGQASPGLTTSMVRRLRADGFRTILLWGVEYWYMRNERYQDGAWWSHMLPFFTRPSPIQGGPSREA